MMKVSDHTTAIGFEAATGHTTAIAPTSPQTDVLIRVGETLVRIPRETTLDMASALVDKLEAWTRDPDSGMLLVAYAMSKPAVAFLWPFLPGIIERAAELPAGSIPPLPKRPRHTDPVIFLARHIVGIFGPLLTLLHGVEVEVDSETQMLRAVRAHIGGTLHTLWPPPSEKEAS